MFKRLPLIFVFLFISFVTTAQIDSTLGITAPKSMCRNYKILTRYLCDGLTKDQDKANAIYNWITHNISYDVNALSKPSFKTDKLAEKALKNRKAVCSGYAMLFTAMCREAGLKSVTIEGYAKDWMFDNGDKLYLPRHMWSAVLVDGQWGLTDPTWGAGGLVQSPGFMRKVLNKILRQNAMYSKKMKFKFNYDPQYFMQDPEAFRFKHLPSDPLWQLTDTTLPLPLFEAGDSAVAQFNEKCSKPKQNSPELTRIGDLDDHQKTFELADRAYKYNSRYPVVMAIKQTYKAASEVEKVFTDSSVQEGMLLITDAENSLKKSQDYIKVQKKSFPEEYSTLKKKNTTKNQQAKQDLRQLKADDKRQIAVCKKYTHSASAKYAKIKKKHSENRKKAQGLDSGNINDVESAKVQKKHGSPELSAITDSISARQERLSAIEKLLTGKDDQIKLWQKENEIRLDTLAQYLVISDSVLVKEAISRIHMHDNYDDEVILLNRLFVDYKYHKADTLQKYYLAGYDSIINSHATLQRAEIEEMSLYKKNLHSMEQYKKWYSNDTFLRSQYADCVMDYQHLIALYDKELAGYAGYVKGNKKLFAYLVKLNRRQVKISDYMDKVEQRRKELEEKTIVKNQEFDNEENERQAIAVKDLLGKLQELSGQRAE